jgi:hypothetical protein
MALLSSIGRNEIRRAMPALFGAVWLCLVTAGLAILWKYETAPTETAPVPVEWPSASSLKRDAGVPTLVMFAHPQCPCTRASIGELASLVAQSQGQRQIVVAFFKPRGAGDEWARTDLWESAAAIPGVEVTTDEEGAEAKRFGALSSGFTVLYDASGKLRFDGGITESRGHSGDNDGREALVSILNHETPKLTVTPVYGCSILDPNPKCANLPVTAKNP